MVPGPGEDESGNRGGARGRMRDFATASEAAKVRCVRPLCFVSFLPSVLFRFLPWGIAIIRFMIHMILIRPMSHWLNILTRFQIIAKYIGCTVARPFCTISGFDSCMHGLISFFVGVLLFLLLFPVRLCIRNIATYSMVGFSCYNRLHTYAYVLIYACSYSTMYWLSGLSLLFLFCCVIYENALEFLASKSKKHAFKVQMPFIAFLTDWFGLGILCLVSFPPGSCSALNLCRYRL